jgi:hypothetical protein
MRQFVFGLGIFLLIASFFGWVSPLTVTNCLAEQIENFLLYGRSFAPFFFIVGLVLVIVGALTSKKPSK